MIHQGSRLQFYGKMCRECYGYSQDISGLQRIREHSPTPSRPTQEEIELRRSRDALNLGLGGLMEQSLQSFEQKGIKPNEIATSLEICARCNYSRPSISEHVTRILPSDS